MEENMIKHVRNIFRLKKENKIIKDIILRDYEHDEEENYYKQVRASNIWIKNYIEYESNNNRNKKYQLKNILIKLDHI